VGWLAGIIDGEGSLNAHSPGTMQNGLPYSPRLTVKVKMCSSRTVFRCKELAGVGAIYPSTTPTGRPCWSWEVHAKDDIVAVIGQVHAHLYTKRDQADTMLELRDAPPERRALLLEKLSFLNHTT
jgi:hypothetical protein